MLQHKFTRLLFALFAVTVLASTATAQFGRGGTVLFFDEAWLAEGEVLAPAFIVVAGGKIQSVSSEPPQARGLKTVKVGGVVTAGMVDAWSGLLPSGLVGSNQRPNSLQVVDQLPADVRGADPHLANRVKYARSMGIEAVYLGSGFGQLRLGLGTPAVFSAHQLPVAEGAGQLDVCMGSARSGGFSMEGQTEELFTQFSSAESLRDKIEGHEEKMTKYEEDLEKHKEAMTKYAEKKKAAEKEGEGAPEADAKDQNAQGKGKGTGKKEGPPKAPKRPKVPHATQHDLWMLEALAGERRVRVQAHSVYDILRLIELKEKYSLDVVLVGGSNADLVAEELHSADIPVVLVATAQHGARTQAARSLHARYSALRDADVAVALASGGGDGNQALLLMRAGSLVAQGADSADVWASLSSVPAALLALPDVGTLQAGQPAHFLHFPGNGPFDATAALRIHDPKTGFSR